MHSCIRCILKITELLEFYYHSTQHAIKPNQRDLLMLTVTSKGEFPYAEARKFGGQLDMQDSSDKPGSILMEAVCHQIIIFFIKPSDSNLSGICVCVCGSYLKAWGQILKLGWLNFEDWECWVGG